MNTFANIKTTAPRFSIGEAVADVDYGSRSGFVVDGLRLQVDNYQETWATEAEDCPSTITAEAPTWEYHLVEIRVNKFGNEEAFPWGWVTEAKIGKPCSKCNAVKPPADACRECGAI